MSTYHNPNNTVVHDVNVPATHERVNSNIVGDTTFNNTEAPAFIDDKPRNARKGKLSTAIHRVIDKVTHHDHTTGPYHEGDQTYPGTYTNQPTGTQYTNQPTGTQYTTQPTGTQYTNPQIDTQFVVPVVSIGNQNVVPVVPVGNQFVVPVVPVGTQNFSQPIVPVDTQNFNEPYMGDYFDTGNYETGYNFHTPLNGSTDVDHNTAHWYGKQLWKPLQPTSRRDKKIRKQAKRGQHEGVKEKIKEKLHMGSHNQDIINPRPPVAQQPLSTNQPMLDSYGQPMNQPMYQGGNNLGGSHLNAPGQPLVSQQHGQPLANQQYGQPVASGRREGVKEKVMEKLHMGSHNQNTTNQPLAQEQNTGNQQGVKEKVKEKLHMGSHNQNTTNQPLAQEQNMGNQGNFVPLGQQGNMGENKHHKHQENLGGNQSSSHHNQGNFVPLGQQGNMGENKHQENLGGNQSSGHHNQGNFVPLGQQGNMGGNQSSSHHNNQGQNMGGQQDGSQVYGSQTQLQGFMKQNIQKVRQLGEKYGTTSPSSTSREHQMKESGRIGGGNYDRSRE